MEDFFMSNHDAGRQVQSVVALAIDLFDDGQISKEIALQFITTAVKSVYYCDGNEYEAYECVENYRCVKCLKQPEKGEKLYDYTFVANELDIDYNSRSNQLGNTNDIPDRALWYNVCKDCLLEMFEKAGITDEQKEKLLKIIDMEHNSENIILCEGYSRQEVYTD